MDTSEDGECSGNWVAAATMLSCPALLMLRARQMQEIPEFVEVDRQWNAEQANQMRRVQLVLKLTEEVKSTEMKVKWPEWRRGKEKMSGTNCSRTRRGRV